MPSCGVGGIPNERKPHLVQWDTVRRSKAKGGLGLRSRKQLNSTCLSKLGWKVLNKGDSLRARVLKSKYDKGHGRMGLFPTKLGDSHIWRGIDENAQTTQQEVGVALRDGRSTKFWLPKWATSTSLLNLANRYVPITEQSYMVSNYSEEGKGWH